MIIDLNLLDVLASVLTPKIWPKFVKGTNFYNFKLGNTFLIVHH